MAPDRRSGTSTSWLVADACYVPRFGDRHFSYSRAVFSCGWVCCYFGQLDSTTVPSFIPHHVEPGFARIRVEDLHGKPLHVGVLLFEDSSGMGDFGSGPVWPSFLGVILSGTGLYRTHAQAKRRISRSPSPAREPNCTTTVSAWLCVNLFNCGILSHFEEESWFAKSCCNHNSDSN